MPVARRCSSNFPKNTFHNAKLSTTMIFCVLGIALSACSVSSTHENVRYEQKVPNSIASQPVNHSDHVVVGKVPTNYSGTGAQSPRCKTLQITGELSARNLVTPTVTTQIDNNGKGKLNVNMDLIDFHKANLQRELYAARCEQHSAIAQSKKLALLSHKVLSYAGHKARVASYRKYSSKISQIRAHLVSGIENGNTSASAAAKIRKMISKQQAKQAKYKQILALFNKPNIPEGIDARGSYQRLLNAQRRLNAVGLNLSRAKAVKVHVEGGYLLDTTEEYLKSEDRYGLIKVSMRLSALDPVRKELQTALLVAGNETYIEPDLGIIDKLKGITEKNRIALVHLRKKRSAVTAQLQDIVPKSLGQLKSDDKALTKQVAAIISTIDLRSELASIDANIDALILAVNRLNLDNLPTDE